jgi:hypothetical protein
VYKFDGVDNAIREVGTSGKVIHGASHNPKYYGWVPGDKTCVGKQTEKDRGHEIV